MDDNYILDDEADAMIERAAAHFQSAHAARKLIEDVHHLKMISKAVLQSERLRKTRGWQPGFLSALD